MSKQHTHGSSQEYGELIAELKGITTTQLRDLLSKMLGDADEKLLDLADSAAYSHEKDVYYWLKKKLLEKKAEVAADFITQILPLLRPYPVTQAEEAAQRVEELDDELSLIGQDDMEDIVLIKNVGAETASKFREQISNLETRLDHLALKTTDIFAKNALAPMKICEAFGDTLLEKFELSERKIMFKLFRDDVAHKLDRLYDNLNNKLIEAGILPQIKLSKGSRPAYSPPPPPPPMDTPPEDQYEPGGEQHWGGDYAAPGAYQAGHHGAGTPQGGGPAPGGGPGMQQGGGPAPGGATGMPQGGGPAPGGGPGMQQGGGPAPGGGTGMPQGGGPSGGGNGGAQAGGGYHVGQTATPGGNYGGGQMNTNSAPGSQTGGGFSGTQPPPGADGIYQHQTAGMPASQVSNTLGNFLGAPVEGGGAEAARSGKEVSSYPTSTAQHFGHDEIISALSSIQAQPQFTDSGELRFDAEAVKQAVLSAIAKTSGGIVTKRMNHIAEKTIDFIELVFDAIIEDDDISDTIKALLLRLQIPVILSLIHI